jgi:hypothetical protein
MVIIYLLNCMVNLHVCIHFKLQQKVSLTWLVVILLIYSTITQDVTGPQPKHLASFIIDVEAQSDDKYFNILYNHSIEMFLRMTQCRADSSFCYSQR